MKKNEIIELGNNSWAPQLKQNQAIEASELLENGNVLYFPNLAFVIHPEEERFIHESSLSNGVKNISFNPNTNQVRGICDDLDAQATLSKMVQRFATQAYQLVNSYFPNYTNYLIPGRTSYRPAEIKGRQTSYRKDDTRLHVDSFPSTPNQGKRLLRVFTNINQQGNPRIWRIGEPFENVAQKFLPQIKPPLPGSSAFLKLLGITKSHRTPYDHYMLNLHDTMKADLTYQNNVEQAHFDFPAMSTWIVFTDQVSHAAMSGQHMLEQTFYLPIDGMVNQNLSPLKKLEAILGKKLI